MKDVLEELAAGNIEKAIELLEQKVISGDKEAEEMLAHLYLWLYNDTGYTPYLRSALNLLEDLAEKGENVYLELATIYLFLGMRDKLKSIKKMLSDEERLYLEALRHLNEGHRGYAKNLLAELIKLKPKIPGAYVTYSMLLMEEGDVDSALEILAKAPPEISLMFLGSILDRFRYVLASSGGRIVVGIFDKNGNLKEKYYETVASLDAFVRLVGIAKRGDDYILSLPADKNAAKLILGDILSVSYLSVDKELIEKMFRQLF